VAAADMTAEVAARPAVSVVLPTFNRASILRKVLEGYDSQADPPPFEVVVTDDGSTDGTWDLLTNLRPRRFTLRAERQENRGPAEARNRAVRAARSDLVLFSGDDIVPGREFVARHLEAHRGGDRIVLGRTLWHPHYPVNAVMYHIDGIGAQQFHYAYLRDGQRLAFHFLYASNASLRRDDLARIDGPFDPRFTLAAFEDADLAYRLIGRRREITYRSALVAFHIHEHTVRTFATRQYRAGAMASVFFRRHPETTRYFRFKWAKTLAEAARRSPDIAAAAVIDWEQALLAALERLEKAEYGRLDQLYLGLFRYFYFKGVTEAHFPDVPAPRMWAAAFRAHVVPPLAPALRHSALSEVPEVRSVLAAATTDLGRAGTVLSTMSYLLRVCWYRAHRRRRGFPTPATAP
jgi:glycosyltransferase involved in cell wall biosynthesis